MVIIIWQFRLDTHSGYIVTAILCHLFSLCGKCESVGCAFAAMKELKLGWQSWPARLDLNTGLGFRITFKRLSMRPFPMSYLSYENTVRTLLTV